MVVLAGFQGITNAAEWEITTLGRGGSDTSAVAMAAALHANYCEIYTDVPGIFTTDPRLIPEAQLMDEITSDEMLELASLGAKVLHPRAVEITRNYGVPLVVRSSWTDDNPALLERIKGKDDPDPSKRLEGDLNRLKKANVQPTADLVYTSGSSLDPHITPEAARTQIANVAKVRGLQPNQLETLIAKNTDGRFLGIFGELGVNVLKLNLALDKLEVF